MGCEIKKAYKKYTSVLYLLCGLTLQTIDKCYFLWYNTYIFMYNEGA